MVGKIVEQCQMFSLCIQVFRRNDHGRISSSLFTTPALFDVHLDLPGLLQTHTFSVRLVERRLTKQSLARALAPRAEIEAMERTMISKLCLLVGSRYSSLQQQSEWGETYRNAGRGYENISYRERSDDDAQGVR